MSTPSNFRDIEPRLRSVCSSRLHTYCISTCLLFSLEVIFARVRLAVWSELPEVFRSRF